MASLKRFLQSTSEILECLEMCPSEDDFVAIDENEENCDGIHKICLTENDSYKFSRSYMCLLRVNLMTIFEGRRSKDRQVIDYVMPRFLPYYLPGASLSADESTVPFKGRIGFKMYNPMKPTKWGLKVFDIACSITGYVLALIPYYGKATTDILGNANHKFNTRIILELVDMVIKSTKSSGYHVFTDRLYTNLQLSKELLLRKIHLTKTIQTNRAGFPNNIKKRAR
ncbi:piggyBac transposable element-derived protein 4-like [Palaemon carinicauda]|uniref:piggyBac transposable element-derived protein 4-like n=1 Tax=Palaemon carinicauda TaxID=392227 RepID=UPI0035B5DEE7